LDFPLIREIIANLDQPLNLLAAMLPEPEKVKLQDGGFRWSYPVQTVEVVQIAKAVRMISGIRAALQLADSGFITECYTILRTTSDFSREITFITEGIINGSFNSSQQKFIDQFFTTFPTDPEELAKRESEKFISRKDINDARIRLAKRAGLDGENLISLIKYLNKGFDSYVHGAYETAMELFSGKTHAFMLNGHDSNTARYRAKIVIALKLHEVIIALELIAKTKGIFDLAKDFAALRKKLEASNEYNASWN
jgi:hypothetical protein